jgi:hypothetical protein
MPRKSWFSGKVCGAIEFFSKVVEWFDLQESIGENIPFFDLFSFFLPAFEGFKKAEFLEVFSPRRRRQSGAAQLVSQPWVTKGTPGKCVKYVQTPEGRQKREGSGRSCDSNSGAPPWDRQSPIGAVAFEPLGFASVGTDFQSLKEKGVRNPGRGKNSVRRVYSLLQNQIKRASCKSKDKR